MALEVRQRSQLLGVRLGSEHDKGRSVRSAFFFWLES